MTNKGSTAQKNAGWALYSSNGTFSGNEELINKYKYLNLPVMLSVSYIEHEKYRGKVYLGSNLAYLLDAESTFQFELAPNYPEESTNKIAYGFLVGTNFFLYFAAFFVFLMYYSMQLMEKLQNYLINLH